MGDLGATATSGVRCRSLDMWHLRIGTGCCSSECRAQGKYGTVRSDIWVCLTIGHRQNPMLYLLFYAILHLKAPFWSILGGILVYWYTPFQDTHFLKLPIWVCRYSPNSRLSALRFLDRPILVKGEDDPVGYRVAETILLSRVTWRSEMPESKGGKHVERRWNKGVSISMLDCYFVVHTKQCEPMPQWRYILTHQVFGSALLDGRWDPQPFLPRAKDDFSQESSKLQHRKSSCGLPHELWFTTWQLFEVTWSLWHCWAHSVSAASLPFLPHPQVARFSQVLLCGSTHRPRYGSEPSIPYFRVEPPCAS